MSVQATETAQQEPQQNTQQNQPQAPEQLSDVLLVMDKEKKTIQAVTGIDENGRIDLARLGIGQALIEDGGEVLEVAQEDRHRGLVHGERHYRWSFQSA